MGCIYERELELPVKGYSERTTKREIVKNDESIILFEEKKNSGCIFHWWLTTDINIDEGYEPSKNIQIKFFYDGNESPSINMSLAHFFGILLKLSVDKVKIDCSAIKVLPLNAFNCYFPIPFNKLKITLTNNSSKDCTIWFMANWQRYDTNINLTKLRLRLFRNMEHPAQLEGSYLMADLSGSGFIAGMVLGIERKDYSDAWFHNGGDLLLLDGESRPRAIRGIGGEDVFGMSFGVYDIQTEWTGCFYTKKTGDDTSLGSGYEGIMYRIFGPDPIWFDTSAVIRFGSKANNYESLIYAYMDEGRGKPILTPVGWELAGPFECSNRNSFNKHEWAETDKKEWLSKYTPEFGQYLVELDSGLEKKAFEVDIPIYQNSEHGWCDFARNFRGKKITNDGTQPANVSAYAKGNIMISQKGIYRIDIGYDDWIKLWVNGEEVFIGMHDEGFETDSIEIELPYGDTDLLVKLSNFNNNQWRLWAFCIKFKLNRERG